MSFLNSDKVEPLILRWYYSSFPSAFFEFGDRLDASNSIRKKGCNLRGYFFCLQLLCGMIGWQKLELLLNILSLLETILAGGNIKIHIFCLTYC